jgi:solute carrier family 25 (peroxisomal adenine nucleotide transporter), member 17
VFVTTPLWVVNTKLKMKGINRGQGGSAQQDVPFNGLIGTEPNQHLNKYKKNSIFAEGLQYIARTEGILALWKGTMPSLILVSNPSIQFMAYESIKRRLMAGKQAGAELGSLVVFLVGAAAKAVATIATYPLQIVQAKLRVILKIKYKLSSLISPYIFCSVNSKVF